MNFTETKEKIIKPGLAITPPEVDPKKEIIEQRGERSKVWNLGGNKRRCIVGIKALHYRNNPLDTNEQFKEIDLTLLPDKTCHKTQYDIQVYDDRVGFSYETKRGGRIDIELQEIGGVAVDYGRVNLVQDGNQIFWNNVADDIDIKVMLRSQSAELYKQLRTVTAAKNFKWKVQRWKNSKCNFQENLSGIDSTLKAGHLEVNTDVVLDKEEIDRNVYTFEEEWTGRVSRIVDPETRIKIWQTDPVYPVVIDLVVNEEVTAGADDGIELNASAWYNDAEYMMATKDRHAGIRFASVGVPQGANITSATMKLFVHSYCNTDFTPQVVFSNVDSAPAWTANNRPSQMPNRLGGVGWNPASSLNTDDSIPGLTSPIQTIVSRSGWSSGNAMRCEISEDTKVWGDAVWFAAHEHATRNPARLDITYTVGGETIPATAVDGVKLGETVSRRAIRRAIVADGFKAGDNDINTAILLTLSQDGLILGDIPISRANLLSSLSDGITIGDISTSLIKLLATVSDGAVFGDTTLNIATLRALLSDGITLGDLPTPIARLITILTDGVTFGDTTLADVLGKLSAIVSDGVVFGDSGSIKATFRVIASDGVMLSDAVTTVMTLLALATDGFTVSDTALEVSTLPTGEVSVTFTCRKSKITFIVSKPGITFASKKPNIEFS